MFYGVPAPLAFIGDGAKFALEAYYESLGAGFFLTYLLESLRTFLGLFPDTVVSPARSFPPMGPAPPLLSKSFINC